MSKKRNTNKVRKALKRKRQKYHQGSHTFQPSRFGGRFTPHSQHYNEQPGPGDQKPPEGPPDAGTPGGPDPEPVDPRVGEVTVEQKDGQAPNVQIKRGEIFHLRGV